MRFIVLVVLVMVSSGTVADWVLIGSPGGRGGGYDIYVDPTTIRRSGVMVKMWHMTDYKTAQIEGGNRYLSMHQQVEYDCSVERGRVHYFIQYSGNMGHGEPVHSTHEHGGTPSGWQPNPPGRTVAGALWKFACGKK